MRQNMTGRYALLASGRVLLKQNCYALAFVPASHCRCGHRGLLGRLSQCCGGVAHNFLYDVI